MKHIYSTCGVGSTGTGPALISGVYQLWEHGWLVLLQYQVVVRILGVREDVGSGWNGAEWMTGPMGSTASASES